MFTADWFRALRDHNLTAQKYVALDFLRANGPTSIGAVADRLGVPKSVMTFTCDKLEAAGLITRERSASDRRVVVVILTSAGVSVLLEKAALAAVS